MEDSIFTKIIRGDIPCQKIYEDDAVFAFLDIQPITPGHTLVIPKQQTDHLWDVEDGLYQHVMEVSKLVAERITEVIKPKRVGMQVMGFDVPHAHVHVFPLHEAMIPTLSKYMERIKTDTAKADPKELQAMAKTLAF